MMNWHERNSTTSKFHHTNIRLEKMFEPSFSNVESCQSFISKPLVASHVEDGLDALLEGLERGASVGLYVIEALAKRLQDLY